MKAIRIIFSLLLIMAISIPTLSAQTKKEKKELKKQAVEKLITSGKYKIDVNRALPARGRSVMLTSPYSVEIRNDSIISHLPIMEGPIQFLMVAEKGSTSKLHLPTTSWIGIRKEQQKLNSRHGARKINSILISIFLATAPLPYS